MALLKKFGVVEKAAGALVPDMEKINRLTLAELTAEEVFVFRLSASNDQIDRDFERFTVRSLKDMAALYVGRTVITDHSWSADGQIARVYDAYVETGEDGITRLMLLCYMLRTAAMEPVIDAIRGGILREVSVSCAVKSARCSICGVDRHEKFCGHRKGQLYDGQLCVIELDGVSDVYEVSFCAVPANAGAGTTKNVEPEPESAPGDDTSKSAWDDMLAQMALIFG